MNYKFEQYKKDLAKGTEFTKKSYQEVLSLRENIKARSTEMVEKAGLGKSSEVEELYKENLKDLDLLKIFTNIYIAAKSTLEALKIDYVFQSNTIEERVIYKETAEKKVSENEHGVNEYIEIWHKDSCANALHVALIQARWTGSSKEEYHKIAEYFVSKEYTQKDDAYLAKESYNNAIGAHFDDIASKIAVPQESIFEITVN